MSQEGERVGALISVKKGVVQFLGYGVYEGDFNPPIEVAGFNVNIPNPRIRLDNGDVVYGCECWWGEEEKFKKEYIDKAKKVVNVKIDEYRRSLKGVL